MMFTLTYVTAFVELQETVYEGHKSFPNRLQQFIRMAETGVPLCLFADRAHQEALEAVAATHPNVRIVAWHSLEDLESTHIVDEVNARVPLRLPDVRYLEKDTWKYMCCILNKTYFLRHAMEDNPFGTERFCWVDFALPYVFKRPTDTLQHMLVLATRPWSSSAAQEQVCIPGWCAQPPTNMLQLTQGSYWRFCGGVVYGDRTSLLQFCNVCEEWLVPFLQASQTLVWEVHFWAWLEMQGHISVRWVPSVFDDKMITQL